MKEGSYSKENEHKDLIQRKRKRNERIFRTQQFQNENIKRIKKTIFIEFISI